MEENSLVDTSKGDPSNEEDRRCNQVFIEEEKLNKLCIDENFVFVTPCLLDDDDSDNTETSTLDPKKKYFCSFEDCNAQFLRPSRLLRHVRQHTGERPYKCTFKDCNKAYTNSSHLKRHLETHNSIKQVFNCPHCPKKLSFLHNLKRHCERMHSGNSDKLICKECGKRFKKIHPFKEHLAAHANSTVKYQCMNCELSFTNHSKLVRHVKCHNNANFRCKLCSIAFQSKDKYIEHLSSVHTNDHICKICNNFFFRKRYLEKHQLSHKTNSVVTCHYENCFRSYFFKRNLKMHIRVSHLGEKFTCELCGREFSAKRKLKRHVQIHTSFKVKAKEKKVAKPPKQRKDKGVPTKSMVSRLIGVQFPHDIEKQLLNRTPEIVVLANNS